MKSLSATTPGSLYIVGTPIGNLQDITFRALEVLKSVSLILAEDTRHAKKLLTFYGIHQPLQSYHTHNEALIAAQILPRLEAGETIALISDAGTPLIQDPGYSLVRLAIEHEITVVPIPGACALITALCASGIACDAFTFKGFLPVKAKAKTSVLNQIKTAYGTTIFYESTHRIVETLQQISDILGPTYEFVLAKELTKTFETFLRGSAPMMQDFFSVEPSRMKGEFVLLMPAIKPSSITSDNSEHLLSVLLDELPFKQAVSIAEKLSGQPKNILYKQALAIKETKSPGTTA